VKDLGDVGDGNAVVDCHFDVVLFDLEPPAEAAVSDE
jgi:hypothetical protein